ncbi:MAG: CDP-diacylglycerol--glycerol-3-phosphate 3-phosphatidyltransferase [Oscillospiraceae bacterium]|jgi:CDP-diacylglycerol--glycerol-3-phosphate 3-phosphatidyltransferase|nr:CDP-diacylglycerol--glycerol-3-phosphate 3-phosphatidyltransferase [Oscillospiraceae bacterium]
MSMQLPNRLTMLRVALSPVYLALLVLRSNSGGATMEILCILAVIVLAAAIVSDALDGYFARKLKQTSELGVFLDPIADKLLVLPSLIWLMHIRAVSPWAVIIIIARELIVDALRLLASSKGVALAAGLSGKVKTVAEYLLLAILTFTLGGDRASPILAWVCAALAVLSASEYFYNNRTLLAKWFGGDKAEKRI